MTNEIGDLGEAIFSVEISRDYTFRPRRLGEKWPASDFYVELIGPKEHFFFIVQVKATSRQFDRKGNLRIKATRNKINELNAYYCPTYLAGVEVESNSVYLMSVNRSRRKTVNKLPTKFLLDRENRARLFNEVKSFWEKSDLKEYKKNFKHSI